MGMEQNEEAGYFETSEKGFGVDTKSTRGGAVATKIRTMANTAITPTIMAPHTALVVAAFLGPPDSSRAISLSTSRECSEDMPSSFVTGTSARCQGSGCQSSSGWRPTAWK